MNEREALCAFVYHLRLRASHGAIALARRGWVGLVGTRKSHVHLRSHTCDLDEFWVRKLNPSFSTFPCKPGNGKIRAGTANASENVCVCVCVWNGEEWQIHHRMDFAMSSDFRLRLNAFRPPRAIPNPQAKRFTS